MSGDTFDVWMQASAMLFDLESCRDPVPADLWLDEWDERCESLIESISIDGTNYLELSPAGQIVHENFRERFRSIRDQILPPAALPGQKRPLKWEDSGHMRAHPEILEILRRLTEEVPQVLHCGTFCFNPDLRGRPGYRAGRDGIEGLQSDGSYTVKFRIETTARMRGQELAMIAFLNENFRV